MITTIPARELHTALPGLAKVTPSKASLPILQGVLIEAAGNTVRLTSTDLDSTVSYTVVNAVVTEPGLAACWKSRVSRVAGDFPAGAGGRKGHTPRRSFRQQKGAGSKGGIRFTEDREDHGGGIWGELEPAARAATPTVG